LRRARRIGLESGLRYVYEGNVPGEGEDTLCPSCGTVVLSRYGFAVRENRLESGRCPRCRFPVDGRWT
jgi:pyruvate formate lyase activating enzyme